MAINPGLVTRLRRGYNSPRDKLERNPSLADAEQTGGHDGRFRPTARYSAAATASGGARSVGTAAEYRAIVKKMQDPKQIQKVKLGRATRLEDVAPKLFGVLKVLIFYTIAKKLMEGAASAAKIANPDPAGAGSTSAIRR